MPPFSLHSSGSHRYPMKSPRTGYPFFVPDQNTFERLPRFQRRDIERQADDEWGRQLHQQCRRERTKNVYMKSKVGAQAFREETERCAELRDFQQRFEEGSYSRSAGTSYDRTNPYARAQDSKRTEKGGEF